MKKFLFLYLLLCCALTLAMDHNPPVPVGSETSRVSRYDGDERDDVPRWKRRNRAFAICDSAGVAADVIFNEELTREFLKRVRSFRHFDALSEEQKRTIAYIVETRALEDGYLLLLSAGWKLPHIIISPAMVFQFGILSDVKKQGVLSAMTLLQRQQLIHCALVLNLEKTLEAVRNFSLLPESGSVIVPEIGSVEIDDSIALATNTVADPAVVGILANLSLKQRNDLFAIAHDLNLGRIIVASYMGMIRGLFSVAIKLHGITITKEFVESLNYYYLQPSRQDDVRRMLSVLDVKQRTAVVSIAQLMDLGLVDKLSDKTTIVITEELARYFNALKSHEVGFFVFFLSRAQKRKLFEYAMSLGFEKLLVWSFVYDKKFLLPENVLLLERVPDAVQQKIIEIMGHEARDLLAMLAGPLNMERVKKQLSLKKIPFKAAIDDDFIVYLSEQDDEFLVQVVNRLDSEQLSYVRRRAVELVGHPFFYRLTLASQRALFRFESFHSPLD